MIAQKPLRSNRELRAAMIVAGKLIRTKRYARGNAPLLELLRRVIREARATDRAVSSASA
jgi:hypothetical protein